MNAKRLSSSLESFFFLPKATEGMAVFRILWGGILFIQFLLDLANVNDFYGPHAIISLDTVRNLSGMQINLFNLFNTSYDVTFGLLAVYGIALITSSLGLFTRPSLIIAFLMMTSLHQRNPLVLSSAEFIMRTITFFLIFSPCGHSYSLDSLLGRYFPQFRTKRDWPLWSWRLIQFQISALYLLGLWQKLQSSAWIDGSSLYYLSRSESLSHSTLPFLMDSLLLFKVLTWATLLIEFSLGALIWNERLRKPLILVGMLFHLTTEFFFSIPFVEILKIVLLINFFSPQELKMFIDSLNQLAVGAINDSSMEVGTKEKVVKALRGEP